MKIISFSGSATKIAGHFAAAEKLEKEVEKEIEKGKGYFDVYAGVSGGAITAFLFAAQKLNEMGNILFDPCFSETTFATNKITNSNNKLKFWLALKKLIFRDTGLTNLTPLKHKLQEIVTKGEFEQLRKKGIQIFIGVVDISKGTLKTVDILKEEYKKAIQYVVASCSIPVYYEPVIIDNIPYVDGGVISHNILNDVLLRHLEICEKATEAVSVYSWKDPTIVYSLQRPTSIYHILNNTLGIFMRNTSVDDQNLERLFCQKFDINLRVLKFNAVGDDMIHASAKYNESQYKQALDDFHTV